MNITGRTVLVTGSAQRIGKQLALTFAKFGARVLVHFFSSEDNAKKTQTEIKAFGGSAEIIKGDLSNAASIQSFIETHQNKLLDVSILVNSASIFLPSPLDKFSPDIFEKSMSLHVLAPTMLSRLIGLNIKKTNTN